MDVPFISSGALNTTHYALVRNVEEAASAQAADTYLMTEVHSIRERLTRPGLTTKQCKEHLILLLYCSTAVSSTLLAHQLEFALPHAVNLAAAGSSIHERRIGYLFCAELMPSDHELQLMLVNTLRKDLESPEAPTICLALDHIIQCPSFDVIPAISARLHDLLSHDSFHIRRRTLLCVNALSSFDPSVLNWLSREIPKRLKDSEGAVVGAALRVCPILHQHGLLHDADLKGSIKILQRAAKSIAVSAVARQLIMGVLTLHASTKSPAKEVIEVALGLIQRMASKGISSSGILLQSFHLLHATPVALLASIISPPQTPTSNSKPTHPIAQIRHILASPDPNDQYMFLACLECLDPVLWAGVGSPEAVGGDARSGHVDTGAETELLAGIETDRLAEDNKGKDATDDAVAGVTAGGNPDERQHKPNPIPSVLEPLEVERMMGFLEGVDEGVRRKTLRILNSIDSSILTAYLSQATSFLTSTRESSPARSELAPSDAGSRSRVPSVPSLADVDGATLRILDVVEVVAGEEGEAYAGLVSEVLNANGAGGRGGVLQRSVKKVLTKIRDGDEMFSLSVATTILSPLSESADPILPSSDDQIPVPSEPISTPSPSIMVIVAALACEYAGRIAIPPKALLEGIATRIRAYRASVQEACLFAMLRLVAELDGDDGVAGTPKGVVERVKEMRMDTGRYMFRRYDQFLKLSSQRDTLRQILSSAKSHSLPDFLLSVEFYLHNPSSMSTSSSKHTSSKSAHSSQPSRSTSSPTHNPNPSSASVGSLSPTMAASKLRYAAYDPPPDPHLGLSRRGMTREAKSDNGRADSHMSVRHGFSADQPGVMTAGELATMGGSVELTRIGGTDQSGHTNSATRQQETHASPRNVQPVDLLGSRADLISLDSPFLTDPPHDAQSAASMSTSNPNPFQRSTSSFASLDDSESDADGEKGFEYSWNELEKFSARGWCEVPVDGIVRRLQGLKLDYRISVLAADQLPFEGELKVLLSRVLMDENLGKGRGALRLRESDEESCLWRLRSDDELLLRDVKKALSDE